MWETLAIMTLIPLFIIVYIMVIVLLLDMIDIFFGTELTHKISKFLRRND